MVLGAAGVFSFFTFGSFGTTDGPLGTGQRKVMAQPSGTLQATSGTLEPSGTGPIAQSAAFVAPTPAQIAASEAQMERAAAGMAARGKALPASGARVSAAAAPPAAETQSTARSVPVRSAASGPLADSDFTFFRATQLSPAAGGLSSSAINEPSVAQNGKYVFETFNWGAARSVNGGATWAYISPYAGMGDFCCDQDVIYDKGRDKMFWLR